MPVVTAQAPLPQSAPVSAQGVPPPVDPTVMAPIIEAPEKAPEETSQASRFAALAQRQKHLRRTEMALKAREEAIKTKIAEYETNYIPKSRLTENPIEVLTGAGLSFDQIAELLLKQSEPASPQLTQMQSEMAKMKQAQEEATKKWQEAEAFKEQQAEKQIEMEAKLLIDSDPEYETIKSDPHGAKAVVLLIKKTLEAGGGFLSVEEAAKKVENYLLEEAFQKANLKKVRARLFPEAQQTGLKAQPTNAAQTSPSKVPQQQSIKTLTNAATAAPSRSMSQAERKQRAIMAFMGQLEG